MQLESVLREVVARADPPPPDLLRHATEAFALRTLDVEVAELVWDSLAESTAVTRGPGDTRIIAVETGSGLRIELDMVTGRDGYELTGEVFPPTTGELRVIHRGGTVTGRVDEHGRFAADLPATASSMKLWFRSDAAASTAPVVTHWVPIT